MQSRGKSVFKKIIKIIAWVIGSVIMLLVTVALLIQIPAIQTWLTQKAVSFLEKKIGTEVSLAGIRIAFPKNIVLEQIYLEDQQGDTLLYAGELSVNTDLWALTKNEIQLNDILLANTVAFVDRAENDSAFNFTYIVDAFAGDSTAVPDTLEQKNWDISLKTLTLENIRLSLQDRLQGNLIALSLGKFEIDMNTFDLENNTFRVEEILLADVSGNIEQTKVTSPSQEPVESQQEDSTAALIISLDELSLENVQMNYKQSALGQVIQMKLGHAQIQADKIDLVNQEVELNTFSLKESLLAYHQHAADTILPNAMKEDQPASQETETKPWSITLDKLSLKTQFNILIIDSRRPKVQLILTIYGSPTLPLMQWIFNILRQPLAAS